MLSAWAFWLGRPSAISIAGASTSARLSLPYSATICISAPGVPGVTAASGPYSGGYCMPCSRKNSGVAPVGATPRPLTPMTFFSSGCQISAWVSPPQPSVSHMVAVAASMAAAASTALPPFWKVMAPAVAPSGFPVTATQCLPCSTGLLVSCASAGFGFTPASRNSSESAAHARKRHVRKSDEKRMCISDSGLIEGESIPRAGKRFRPGTSSLLRLDFQQHDVGLDQVVFRRADRLDGSGNVGLDRKLHLHRFHQRQRLAFGDLVALGDDHLDNLARHGCDDSSAAQARRGYRLEAAVPQYVPAAVVVDDFETVAGGMNQHALTGAVHEQRAAGIGCMTDTDIMLTAVEFEPIAGFSVALAFEFEALAADFQIGPARFATADAPAVGPGPGGIVALFGGPLLRAQQPGRGSRRDFRRNPGVAREDFVQRPIQQAGVDACIGDFRAFGKL